MTPESVQGLRITAADVGTVWSAAKPLRPPSVAPRPSLQTSLDNATDRLAA